MPSYLGVNVLYSHDKIQTWSVLFHELSEPRVHDHDDARAVCVAVPELVIPASQKAMRW